MKRIGVAVFMLFFCANILGQVGIGTTSPNANAALDIESTTSGILIPRLTTAQRNAIEDNDPATPPPSDLESGTMIFNTDFDVFQYWNSSDGIWRTVGSPKGTGVGNEGVVVMDFSPVFEVTSLRPGFFSKLILNGIRVDRDYSSNPVTKTTTASAVVDSVVVRNDFGDPITLDFDEDDFDFNTDATDWPENAPDTDKDGIWNETDNTIYENPMEGQVHMWRISFEYKKASKDTTIQITMENPNNGFEVNAQHRASEVDLGGSDRYKASVLLLTIADANSLPSGLFATGTGNGYEINLRTNGEIDELAITKITRISFFKD